MKKFITFLMYPIVKGAEMNKLAKENKAIEKQLRYFQLEYGIYV